MKGWEEEVESKSSMKLYWKANDVGTERYVRVQQGVRLMFRLRSSSVCLLQDKKRCGLCVVSW